MKSLWTVWTVGKIGRRERKANNVIRSLTPILVVFLSIGCGPSPGQIINVKRTVSLHLTEDGFKETVQRRGAGSMESVGYQSDVHEGSVLRVLKAEKGGAKVLVEKAYKRELGSPGEEAKLVLDLVFSGDNAWILDEDLATAEQPY